MNHRGTTALGGIILLLGLAWTGGCGEVEWNYESTWWQRPNRVVRPTSGPRASTTRPAHDRQDRPRTVAEPRTAVVAPGETPKTRKAPAGGRPFYQLYLRSPSSSAETRPVESDADDGSEERGEHLYELRNVSAGPCSRLLEMLYVPMGRSGGPTECYLLYENAQEFEAAVEFAPLLDITPATSAPAGLLDAAAFEAGVALTLQALEQGAIVDRGLVDEAEKRLSTAAQSGTLPARQRWAAAVIAGRLVADYRYDFATARSHYRQAERAVATDSIETMTARWWQADAWVQEGRPKEARAIYAGILQSFDSRYKKSYIVERAWTTMQRETK